MDTGRRNTLRIPLPVDVKPESMISSLSIENKTAGRTRGKIIELVPPEPQGLLVIEEVGIVQSCFVNEL